MNKIVVKNKGNINVFKTNKFKENTINFKIFFEATKYNLSCCALMCNLLTDRTISYSSKDKMLEVCDNLYGASVYASNAVVGYYGILDITIQVINGDYVEEKLLNKQIEFLSEIIFRPLIDDNSFIEAKNNVLTELNRNLDKPNKYAYLRAMQVYGKEYPCSINEGGEIEVVEKISIPDILSWYQDILMNNYREINFVGNGDEKLLIELMNKFEDNDETISVASYHKHFYALSEINKNAKIDQSQLIMIYNHPINVSDDDYFKLVVANTIFGQLPTSLLFQEVREKRSLCYSVHSRLLTYSGGLVVTTGLDVSNIDLAHQLIEELKERVINGEFDVNLLDTAKEMLIDSRKSNLDYPSGYINDYLRMCIGNKNHTFEEIERQIKKVSLKDVKEVFRDLKLEVVFKYKQEEK